MPETMSIERRIAAARASAPKLVLTPGREGMRGAIDKAEEIAAEPARTPSCRSSSRTPPTRRSTGAPPPRRSGTTPTARSTSLVAGVGTGGTITGVGEVLKRAQADLPGDRGRAGGSRRCSSGGQPGPHKIQGIGAGFIPTSRHASSIDEVIAVADDEAFEMARRLARGRGHPRAASPSGANVCAALEVARRPENAGKLIVVDHPELRRALPEHRSLRTVSLRGQ